MEVRIMSSEDIFEMQILNQAKKIENEYKKEKERTQKLRKNFEIIAKKICNFKYAQKQLGGKNQILSMKDNELRDFIIDNVLEQKVAFMRSLEEVQTLYFQEIKEKKQLAKRVLELEKELNAEASGNPLKAIDNHKNVNTDSGLKGPVPNLRTSSHTLENLENILTIDGKVWDIPNELQKLNIYQEEMIKVLGESGYSETRQIYDEVMKRMDVQETTLKNQMAGLVENIIVESELVSTFLRRNLNLYGLTGLGEEIYRHLTYKNPVKSEKNKLKTQHSSLKHAYSIKDTATILQELGYTNISIDSSSNQIQVSGGNRYVPDIIANFDANKKTYWEVELAHHKDGDFFEKLQKAAKVTDTIYIIAPDKPTFDKLKNQVGRYRADLIKKGLKTQLTIFIGTMNHLKKREIFSNAECRVKIG